MNATENTERPENAPAPDDPAPLEGPTVPERPAGPAGTDDTDVAPEAGGTSLYVRRGRTPTLGFWVALAIAVPALAALLSAPFLPLADLTGVFNFVLVTAVFVGLPLAAIAALVDALTHRRPRRRRR